MLKWLPKEWQPGIEASRSVVMRRIKNSLILIVIIYCILEVQRETKAGLFSLQSPAQYRLNTFLLGMMDRHSQLILYVFV